MYVLRSRDWDVLDGHPLYGHPVTVSGIAWFMS